VIMLPANKAADHIGLSVYMLKTHGPAPVRVGRRIYWRVADLDAFAGNAEPDEDQIGRLIDQWRKSK